MRWGAGQRVRIGILTKVFTAELVDAAIAEHGRAERRRPLLPTRLVVCFVLALCLFTRESYEEVLRVLTSGIPGSRALVRVNRSSLCRARADSGRTCWRPCSARWLGRPPPRPRPKRGGEGCGSSPWPHPVRPSGFNEQRRHLRRPLHHRRRPLRIPPRSGRWSSPRSERWEYSMPAWAATATANAASPPHWPAPPDLVTSSPPPAACPTPRSPSRPP
ncbi:transposase domain-containing protein [Streptomyces yangpuensis]|uniref:transposase domain-containing protein n=1 Tax=Streptomyces yangpuensis TaxID=1648182 RepID=UPI00371AF071